MRHTWWTAAALLMVALSGCFSNETGVDAPATTVDTPAAVERPPLPANITETLSFVGGFDIPTPVDPEAFCWMPSNTCQEVLFTVPEGAHNMTIDAAIGWGGAAHNYGLFVYQGSELLEYDSSPMASNQQREMSYTFTQGGDYRLVVGAHWSGPETVQLEATFTYD